MSSGAAESTVVRERSRTSRPRSRSSRPRSEGRLRDGGSGSLERPDWADPYPFRPDRAAWLDPEDVEAMVRRFYGQAGFESGESVSLQLDGDGQFELELGAGWVRRILGRELGAELMVRGTAVGRDGLAEVLIEEAWAGAQPLADVLRTSDALPGSAERLENGLARFRLPLPPGVRTLRLVRDGALINE